MLDRMVLRLERFILHPLRCCQARPMSQSDANAATHGKVQLSQSSDNRKKYVGGNRSLLENMFGTKKAVQPPQGQLVPSDGSGSPRA